MTAAPALPALRPAPALPAPHTTERVIAIGRQTYTVVSTVSYQVITDPDEISKWHKAFDLLVKS